MANMAEEEDISKLREQVEAESREEGETETHFEDGFSGKTIVGALFVGLIMLPGALYLGLVAGQGLGPAAEWVTIVLFAEIMRRSFLPMKRQEIYILYYVAASLTHITLGDKGLSGGPFGSLIWNQYFITSPPASVIARDIPGWVVPPPGSAALQNRTFFDMAWLYPILLLILTEAMGRLNWISAGYVLFRVTSDVERLPFPMAPVAASGATALAEAASKEESWRWRVFSIGSMIGLIFGFFYIAIPIFTSVVFNKAFTLIPIPFFDLTTNTESILPAALTGVSGDLTKILTGFVLPYPIVQGSLVGSIVCRVLMAPVLQKAGAFGDSPKQRLDARNGCVLHQAGNRHQVLDVGGHRSANRRRADRSLQRVSGILENALAVAQSWHEDDDPERARRCQTLDSNYHLVCHHHGLYSPDEVPLGIWSKQSARSSTVPLVSADFLRIDLVTDQFLCFRPHDRHHRNRRHVPVSQGSFDYEVGISLC